MKRIFCLLIAVALTLSLAACGGTAQLGGSTAPGDAPGALASQPNESREPGTSVAPPSGKPVDRKPHGVSAEELILPLPNVKKLDAYDKDTLLGLMQDAYAEFMNDESTRKFFTFVKEEEGFREREYTYEMPNGVTVTVTVSEEEEYYTKEIIRAVKYVKVYANTHLFTVWPGASVYAPVRAFVCDTREEAESLTSLLLGCKMKDTATEAAFLPLQYRNCSFTMHNEITLLDPKRPENDRLPTFTMNFPTVGELMDTVSEWKRLPMPKEQEINLNELGYDHVLTHRTEYINAVVTVKGTATKPFSDDKTIVLELPGLEYRTVGLRYDDPEVIGGIAEGDTVTAAGVLTHASYREVKTRIDDVSYEDYVYVILLNGMTCEKAK